MDWLVALTVVIAGAGRVEPGTPFRVTDELRDELVPLGAARRARPDEIPVDEDEAPSGSPLAALAPLAPERLAAIEAVLSQLDAESFTAAGAPKVIALRALLGFAPTAEETARFKRPES